MSCPLHALAANGETTNRLLRYRRYPFKGLLGYKKKNLPSEKCRPNCMLEALAMQCDAE